MHDYDILVSMRFLSKENDGRTCLPPVSIRTSDRSHAGGGHWTERAQRAREAAGAGAEWRIARFLPQAKMAPDKIFYLLILLFLL